MSRRPLKPINLNLKLNISSASSKTRPSMSQTEEIMAADSTDPCPTAGLNSPMTNLAMNMSELSTRRGTPKRRLSLSSVDTPPSDDCHASLERAFSSASSTESGVFVDSPTLIDSPTLESIAQRYKPDIPIEAFTKKKTIAFRRINSLPPPALRLDSDSPTEFLDSMETDDQCHSAPATSAVLPPPTPTSSVSCGARVNFFLEEASSQDSGVGLDKDLGFKIPAPVSFLRRKSKLNDICEEANSPHKYSPIKSPQKRPLSFSLGVLNAVSPTDYTSSKMWIYFSHQLHIFIRKIDLGCKIPAPVSFLRRKSKLNDICEEANSPHKYSPIKSPQKRPLSFSLGSFQSSGVEDDSPVRLKRSSLSRCEGNDDDDGFLDLMDQEVSQITDQIPQGMTSLMNDPVLEEPNECIEPVEDSTTPVSRKILPAKRFLRRSHSVDVRTKRTEPPEELVNHSKRWKSEKSHDDSFLSEADKMSVRRLHRSYSETAEMIMSAVHRMSEEPDLIADSSKPHVLPMVNGKHQDLKSISPETLSMLMSGEYADQVEEFHIIDCRFPYEFEGGHIKNALNIWSPDALLEEYLKNPKRSQDPNKRFLLVFHCEFSSERGPKLFRFLRSKDRESNKECYPFLYYPEIYLLEGGYKAFFEHHKHLCQPQTYTQMLHKDFSEDLRKFRAKSKSWAGEKNGNRPGLRNLKF
ncbi:uncharacterized protein LOC143277770 [Babylonia areolata]|uniref:uncharacterized protein LOC143277770 n=1 Tax=Babylonia areolata TaxID=304850 RepID=UPI003FD36528